jgi:hypothetical protein
MSVTRGEISAAVLRILQKNAGYQGFYTPDKIADAIQDSVDHVSVEMMMDGEGWLRRIEYLETYPNKSNIPLPPHIAIIDEVRYLVGNRYIPLTYDDATMSAQFGADAGVSQFPSRYRIIDNNLYFNPTPAEVGPNYIQLECACFPQRLVSDGQVLNPQFNVAMTNYIKWRCASMLAASAGKPVSEWKQYEAEWHQNMLNMVQKRNRTPTFVREFNC